MMAMRRKLVDNCKKRQEHCVTYLGGGDGGGSYCGSYLPQGAKTTCNPSAEVAIEVP